MKNSKSSLSAITRDCTNFKNYLKNKFEIEDFGEFICSYTFPLDEIEALKKAAEKAKKTPVSLRLYYGCNDDGTGHKLYISLLDKQGEVIVDSSSANNNQQVLPKTSNIEENVNHILMAAAPEEERKCPPGGTSDRFVQKLFS